MRRVNHKATAKVLAGILAAVLGLSALTGCDDYVMAGDFYERRPGKKPDPPGREPVAMLLHGTVADRPQLARLASPVLHAHHEAAPCLLLHGTDDLLVPFDQSVRMEQALQRVGAAVQLVAVDGADHGFDKTPWMSRCWSFLRLHMQRT